tara:strand:+ start:984 stop:1154 length:171 start_codon:yes stop_codon:yes gene_type:complete
MSESSKKYLTLDYFNYLDDEILIEMAMNHPIELNQLCSLISLDIQLEIERSKTLLN